MRALRRLGSLSAVITTLTVLTAVQMGLIVFGNITDYETNHEFVIHVLAMDTTFQSPATMWRAITNPDLVTAAYLAVIAWELVSAVLLFTAAGLWLRPPGNSGHDAARRFSTAGWLMWLALFGGGFITIGGEWFEMWESTRWNGLDPALQNFTIASVGLILTQLPRHQPNSAAASANPGGVAS